MVGSFLDDGVIKKQYDRKYYLKYIKFIQVFGGSLGMGTKISIYF